MVTGTSALAILAVSHTQVGTAVVNWTAIVANLQQATVTLVGATSVHREATREAISENLKQKRILVHGTLLWRQGKFENRCRALPPWEQQIEQKRY